MEPGGDLGLGPEDVAFLLWPTQAIEGALAERHKLLGIIDRASDALPPDHDVTQLENLAEELDRFSARLIRSIVESVRKAAAALSEADPADETEGEGGIAP